MAFGSPLQTINHWEKAYRVPSLETLWRLADFFGVSIDYLIGHPDKSADIPCEGGKQMRVIANLAGEWVDITEEGYIQKMRAWKFAITPLWNEVDKHGFMMVDYGGHEYRLHPSFIQIVTGSSSTATDPPPSN
jgi:transcriptional regulator with XRE-family HTH domain